jgi:hypothetical protein
MAFYRLSVVVITLLIAMNGIGTLAILEANPENLEAKSSSADDNIQNAPERPEQEEPEDGGAYYDNPIPPYDASVVPIEVYVLFIIYE